MAKTIDLAEVARRLGLDESCIRVLCEEGRIHRARLVGEAWLFPDDFTRTDMEVPRRIDNSDGHAAGRKWAAEDAADWEISRMAKWDGSAAWKSDDADPQNNDDWQALKFITGFVDLAIANDDDFWCGMAGNEVLPEAFVRGFVDGVREIYNKGTNAIDNEFFDDPP